MMRPHTAARRIAACGLAALACGPAGRPARSDAAAAAGIDSLDARLAAAYQARDADAYAALYTDSAVFEWPTLAPIRGRPAMRQMAQAMWAPQRDVALRLRVATRRVAAGQATEVGAFEQSWRDSAGVRRTEFGRYAALLVQDAAGRWQMDRFVGFEDSTRVDGRAP